VTLFWSPRLLTLDRDQCLALLTTETVGDLITPDRASTNRRVNYRVNEDGIVLDLLGSSLGDTLGGAGHFSVDHHDRAAGGGWHVDVEGVLEPSRPELDSTGRSPAEGGGVVRCRLHPRQMTGRLVFPPLYPTYPQWPERGRASQLAVAIPAPPAVTETSLHSRSNQGRRPTRRRPHLLP